MDLKYIYKIFCDTERIEIPICEHVWNPTLEIDYPELIKGQMDKNI